MCRIWLTLGLILALAGPTRADVFGVPPPFLLPLVKAASALVTPYTGPGDIKSGATWFHGNRAYSAAVAATGTQKAKNIRRADTHTCDVLIATTGFLGNTANCSTPGDNGQTEAAFCNATTCSNVTWYDQTGNSVPVTQSTVANQPSITQSCLGSSSCLSFNAAGPSFMNNVLVTTLGTTYTFAHVSRRTGAFTTTGVILSMQFGGQGADFYGATVNTMQTFSGNTGSVTAADSTWHAEATIVNGASSFMCLDGTCTSVNAGTTATGTQLSIGSQPPATGTLGLTGDMEEDMAWGTVLTQTEANAITANQRSAWGF